MDIKNKPVLLNHSAMDAIAYKLLNGSVVDNTNIEHKNIIEPQCLVYYRSTRRGGQAVIISPDGEWLLKDPFKVNYEEHLQMFLNGERTEEKFAENESKKRWSLKNLFRRI